MILVINMRGMILIILLSERTILVIIIGEENDLGINQKRIDDNLGYYLEK